EQEYQHQDRVAGALVDQACEVVNVFANDPLSAERDHYQEGSEVHEGVDKHVDRDALDAGRVAGDQAEQHVSGVRDGAVGEQTLDVRLRDGGQVTNGHGGDGDTDEKRLPGGTDRSERS